MINRFTSWRGKTHACGKPTQGWIIPLSQLNQTHLSEAGGKAVTLGQMARAGLPVPPGFVITTAAFHQFLQSVPNWAEIDGRLGQLTPNSFDNIQALSREAIPRLAHTPVAAELTQAVQTALNRFSQVRLWAVRSSATAEDSAAASFAGQHDSFLNVPATEVLQSVRRCWTSLFSTRAILYRLHNQIPARGAAMAVIVQQMVPADLSGVLFTADPATGSTDRIVIESAPGLGDQLVSGRITPTRTVLAKVSLAILKRATGNGSSQLNPSQVQTVPETSPRLPVLGDEAARRAARLSRRAEQLLAQPLDMEWAISAGQFYVLQARPITGHFRRRAWEDRQVWSNLNTGEVLPDVATPVTWSLIRTLLGSLVGPVFRLAGADLGQAPLIGLVGGRIYFSLNTALAVARPFRFLLHSVPKAAQALGGGHLSLLDSGMLLIPEEDLPDLGFRWTRYLLSFPSTLIELWRHSPGKGDAWSAGLEAQPDPLQGLKLEQMSRRELDGLFSRLLRESFAGWDLVYLGTQAVALPFFEKACRTWLGDRDLAVGYRLFSGLGGLPEAQAGLDLWRLSALADGDPTTKLTVLSSGTWEQVCVRLDETEHGRHFLTAWDNFMRVHGHHCRGELELGNARWSETPEYVLGLVRGYLREGHQTDPIQNQKRLAQEREQLTAQCCRQLGNPVKRWIFLRSLRRAQKLAVNREVWKNQAVRHITALRRVLQALGQRLSAEGILDQPSDIFFLEVEEIETVANERATFDVRVRIAQRRAEYDKNLKLSPPPVVFGRFDPAELPFRDGETPAAYLEGIPVYPGVVTGPARVILRTDDHQQVRPGEILVAPFTDPAWTPYFISAAALVVDQGGILSHGSIVARELGLPAVTNVGAATRLIHTGDRLEVDGTSGRVRILERINTKP